MGCSIPITCDGCDMVPHIGENGNWYVGGTDTGVKAQGPAGQDADKSELERLNRKIDTVAEKMGSRFHLGYTMDMADIPVYSPTLPQLVMMGGANKFAMYMVCRGTITKVINTDESYFTASVSSADSISIQSLKGENIGYFVLYPTEHV